MTLKVKYYILLLDNSTDVCSCIFLVIFSFFLASLIVSRITNSNDVNIVLKVNGATITDNYWVKPVDNIGLTWDKVNYFSNLALYGNFESFNKIYDKELDYNTPELTNIGSYEKCWRL